MIFIFNLNSAIFIERILHAYNTIKVKKSYHIYSVKGSFWCDYFLEELSPEGIITGIHFALQKAIFVV